MSNLYILATESLAEGEENVMEGNLGGVEQQAQDNTESVETELLQVNEQTDNMIDDVETVSDGMDAQDTVEREIAVLESLAAKGGLDKNGAVLLNLHIESWNRMFGIPGLFSLGVAVESFGPSNGATQLSYGLEGVKERASAIWKKLKEIFANLTRRIKEFFQGLFNVIKKYEFRINNLKSSVSKKGKFEAGEALKESSYSNNLVYKGEVQSISNSIAVTNASLSKAVSTSSDSENQLAKAFDFAEKQITSGDEEDFKPTYDFGESITEAEAVKSARSKTGLADGAVTGYAFPGNIYACLVKKDKDLKFAFVQLKTKKELRADIQLLDDGGCNSVLALGSKVLESCKSLREYGEKCSKRREQLVDKLEKHFHEKSESAEGDEEKGKVAKAQSAIRKTASFSQEIMDKPFLYLGKYGLNQLKVYLDLVEKSIKAGKSEEDKKKEAEKEAKKKD